MAIEYKALLEQDGVTVQTTAIFDSENIPDGFADWIACGEEVTSGWTFDGSTFIAPPPPPPPSSAELDALADELATELVEQDAKFRVLGRLTFELAKAIKTNNLTFFDGVTDAQSYKALVTSMFRSEL
jgi:hypothetical protein